MAWLPMPFAGTNVIQQTLFDCIFKFASFDAVNRNIFSGYTHASSGYIPLGRNILVEKFLKTDAEWFLSIDWDIVFQPEDVYKLIDAADPNEVPIIAGCYVTYMGDDAKLTPCWMVHADEAKDIPFEPAGEIIGGRIVPLTLVGMGFTLIHRTVLETMQKNFADDPWPWFGHDIVGGERLGEDWTFCQRARESGFTIWGHEDVQLGHSKSKILYPSDL